MNKVFTFFLVAATFFFPAVGFSAGPAPLTSIYTPLYGHGCHDTDTGIVCPGAGRYRLQIDDEGNVMAVSVLGPKAAEVHALSGTVAKGTGGKAEWLGSVVRSVFTPSALIVRLDVGNDTPFRTVLLVAKVTPAEVCTVGIVEPQRLQNEAARKMAAKAAGMPCLRD